MTYPQARERLFAYLRNLGWTVKPGLKVPQAVTPAGNIVYFKAQAVYLNQHSLWLDIRQLTPHQFVEAVVARESSRDPSRVTLREPFFVIMVYGRWGSEPYSTAKTLREAKAKALAASKSDPKNEYVVEIEPGGFDNPIYKGGKSLRMTKMTGTFHAPNRLQRRKTVAKMGMRKRVGRDPGRVTKSSAHARQAAECVRRGRAAEDEGVFSSAAVWYGKAAGHYAKAAGPRSTRARLWAKRALDVKGKREMGTTYRGEKKAWHRDPGRQEAASRPAYYHQWQGHRFGYVKIQRTTKKRHLTAAQRKSLRPSQFALPERRLLPLIDKAHVRNAAVRLQQMYNRGTVERSEYKMAMVKIWAAEKRLKIGSYYTKKGTRRR